MSQIPIAPLFVGLPETEDSRVKDWAKKLINELNYSLINSLEVNRQAFQSAYVGDFSGTFNGIIGGITPNEMYSTNIYNGQSIYNTLDLYNSRDIYNTRDLYNTGILYQTGLAYFTNSIEFTLANVKVASSNATAATAGVNVGGIYRTNADPSHLCIRSA